MNEEAVPGQARQEEESALAKNDDWQATKEIYEDALISEDGLTAVLQIPISLVNMIAIQLISAAKDTSYEEEETRAEVEGRNNSEEANEYQVEPRFKYLVLSEMEDLPIVEISFRYPSDEEDCYATSVSIEILQYPKLWPAAEKERWVEWISKKSNEILKEMMLSYAICDFVEHNVMTFFETVDENSLHGYSAILFKPESFGYYDDPWKLDKSNLIRFINDVRFKKKLPYDTPAIHKYARHALKRNWKRYMEYECPICFTTELCSDAIELPCGHFYCRTCLEMYVKTIVADIKMHRVNPFICPITTCKADMHILGSACGDIPACEIVTEEQKQRLLEWNKNIMYPLANVLTICPRLKCKASGLRRLNNDSTQIFVKCEECNAIFCELCLKRIYKKDIGYDHKPICDETDVLKLVKRYKKASREVKVKCHEKWHWLEEYASNREMDASAALWILQNAAICPTCKNGIERSEGCFHMHCTQCGTHFCYECGEEIFYPFYGTHHCWEQVIEDMNFGLFD